jgi:hypothetical protein
VGALVNGHGKPSSKAPKNECNCRAILPWFKPYLAKLKEQNFSPSVELLKTKGRIARKHLSFVDTVTCNDCGEIVAHVALRSRVGKKGKFLVPLQACKNPECQEALPWFVLYKKALRARNLHPSTALVQTKRRSPLTFIKNGQVVHLKDSICCAACKKIVQSRVPVYTLISSDRDFDNTFLMCLNDECDLGEANCARLDLQIEDMIRNPVQGPTKMDDLSAFGMNDAVDFFY